VLDGGESSLRIARPQLSALISTGMESTNSSPDGATERSNFILVVIVGVIIVVVVIIIIDIVVVVVVVVLVALDVGVVNAF
jgi:hypothetical protein